MFFFFEKGGGRQSHPGNVQNVFKKAQNVLFIGGEKAHHKKEQRYVNKSKVCNG